MKFTKEIKIGFLAILGLVMSVFSYNYLKQRMKLTLFIIVLLFIIFYLFRPTSKEELKRFKNNDNWSNMGF